MFGWILRRRTQGVKEFAYFPDRGYATLKVREGDKPCCVCERNTTFHFEIDAIEWPCCNDQGCYDKCVSEARSILQTKNM